MQYTDTYGYTWRAKKRRMGRQKRKRTNEKDGRLPGCLNDWLGVRDDEQYAKHGRLRSSNAQIRTIRLAGRLTTTLYGRLVDWQTGKQDDSLTD